MISLAFFSPPILHSAEEHSYAREIQQYVDEDKVYLLENIQQNITRPAEKIVVDALLCESGPQAIELFKKQLKDYPDPVLDQLSTSRIAAYSMALDSTAPLPKLSRPLPSAKPHLAGIDGTTILPPNSVSSKPPQKPAPLQLTLTEKPKQEAAQSLLTFTDKPKRETTIAKAPTVTLLTLQFGSFTNKESAETLAKKISLYEPAKTIQQGEFYKVLLKKNYTSKGDAADMVKKLPFIAIIVPAKEAQH
jgi:hypothetical protein